MLMQEAHLRRPRISVRLFGVVVASAAFMPFVPGFDIGTMLFLASLAVFLFRVLLMDSVLYLPQSGLVRWRGLAIIAFFSLCICSVLWLLAHGGEVSHWFRAVVPFGFFMLYPLFPQLTQLEVRHLAGCILLGCALWSAKVFFLLIAAIDSNGVVVFLNRLTFFVTDSVLVFPLVGVPLLLFSNVVRSGVVRVSALSVLVFLYVWIGYRAGLVIIFGCFLIRFFFATFGSKALISLIALMGLVPAASLAQFELVEQLTLRYATLIEDESDGSRVAELRYAWESGTAAPVFGKGLGWQVPFDVAFAGVDPTSLGEQAARSSVGYIHSMPAYFFMNLGVIGLLLAIACYAPWRFSLSKLGSQDLGAAAALASLCVFSFSLTQASFRTIQTIVLTVALVKIADSMWSTSALVVGAGGSGVRD